jgi:hypothetical protein
VIAQIADDQWDLMMPSKITREPMSLTTVVRYHIWDSAWIPDGLAGKTIADVGDSHDHLLKLPNNQLKNSFVIHNKQAIEAVRDLYDLNRVVHLTYGDFPAREYLQHNISVRAFWSYDIAKLIGIDSTMADDFVQALMDEFRPAVDTYRRMHHFPPEVKVPSEASLQTKLLAMVGRS